MGDDVPPEVSEPEVQLGMRCGGNRGPHLGRFQVLREGATFVPGPLLRPRRFRVNPRARQVLAAVVVMGSGATKGLVMLHRWTGQLAFGLGGSLPPPPLANAIAPVQVGMWFSRPPAPANGLLCGEIAGSAWLGAILGHSILA